MTLISGSRASVFEPAAWIEKAETFVREAHTAGVPQLGVCFGHQLLGHVLGGKVVKNPVGREIGTVEVKLTDAGVADPLLQGVPAQAPFQATHEDTVSELPAGAVLLAENKYGVHGFRWGRCLWGVQFHPELDERRLGMLIESREEALRREGPRRIRVCSAPSAEGPQIAKCMQGTAPLCNFGIEGAELLVGGSMVRVGWPSGGLLVLRPGSGQLPGGQQM